MLTEPQLIRINHLRTSAGRNVVTMEQAEILLNRMTPQALSDASERIGGPPLEYRKPLNCWCVPGATVEQCPVHVSGKEPEFEEKGV